MAKYDLRGNNLQMDDDKRYILRIRDMQEDDKPREKLLKHGPDGLGSPELLAVILNTGTKKEDVMSMAGRLLAEYGETALFNQKQPRKLSEELDIPCRKRRLLRHAGNHPGSVEAGSQARQINPRRPA